MIEIPPSAWPTLIPYHQDMSATFAGQPSPWWTSSAVRLFARCKAAAHRRYILGQPEPEREKTADKRLGTAVHRAVLEPQEGLTVVSMDVKPPRGTSPEKRRALARAKKWGHIQGEVVPIFSAFKDLLRQDGTPGDLYRRAEGAFWTLATCYPPGLTRGRRPSPAFEAAYVETDSLTVAQHYLTRPTARKEWTCFAEDLDTGLPIKCRDDLVLPSRDGGLIIADLKVTNDVTPYAFARTARRFRYDLAAAHYRRVHRAWLCDPGLPVTWYWIALQSVPVHGRHPCVVYECTTEQLDAADAELLGYLEGIAECMTSGRWPPTLIAGESWEHGAAAVDF
jgi:hypothetical protein